MSVPSPEGGVATIELLQQRLASLAPTRLEIRDESHRHAGHAGAREGGHYEVLIVAARFAGLSTLERHRLVYDAVGNLREARIHALSIRAKTPEEHSTGHST